MNKKKFIVNNIKLLNKDHQVYLYDIIKFNSHASNTNGFFFQLSEMDEKSIDDIYDFIVKIISAKKNLDDLERMELRDDLKKGLKVEEESNNTIEVFKQNNDNYNEISVVISEHKIYNIEEIEGRMKDVFKNKKYKVDSIFFKLDKQMKMAKKNNRVRVQKLSADIRHDTLAPSGNSGNSDFDIENTDEDMDNNEDETDPVADDEDIDATDATEATDAVGDDDDDDIDATEPGDDEDDEADIDVTEDIDEDEDIDEELDEERFRMLLLSKGYNVTDHSQLKEEPYNYHLAP